jgi:hypothetical protein
MLTLRHIARRLSWTRHIARVGTALGLAAMLGGIAGCADDPSAAAPTSPPPAAQPSQSLLSTVTSITSTVGTVVNGLLWTSPVTSATASATIGPNGGSFGIPNGIQVVVPKGAVSTNVSFSVTRVPGVVVAYEFQPHGTKFAVPVEIHQPTQGTNLLKLAPGTPLTGVYVPDLSTLDQLLGTALGTEFRSATVSADGQWIDFTVQHFSGYLVAWGSN